jgi:actin-related protein
VIQFLENVGFFTFLGSSMIKGFQERLENELHILQYEANIISIEQRQFLALISLHHPQSIFLVSSKFDSIRVYKKKIETNFHLK